MNLRAGLLSLVFLVALAGVSVAGTFGEPKVNHRFANATSLKITEPDGFKVTLTTADGDKVGTIPEVFALADRDEFVKVTVTAPDGTVWTKKIEVQSKKQTELAISFKGDAPKAAPQKGPTRSYIGRMHNKAGGCGSAWKGTIKTDFIHPDTGEVKASAQVDNGANKDVEVPAGTWEVRVFLYLASKEWKFITTGKHEIKTDGWKLGFGCNNGQPIVTPI